MPIDGSSSPRSYSVDFGNVLTVALRALASSGVKARSACCTRFPSWASTSPGTSLGVWVTKNTPTPFERISRTVRAMASRNASLASSNSRCASSKKNTSLGFSTSPTSGRSWNRSASSHMRNVENSLGLSCTADSPITDSTPLPSGVSRIRSAVSNSGSPKNASPPPSCSPISSRRMTPAVAGDSPPSPARSALPSSLTRWLITARRSFRSSSGSPAPSAKWNTRPRLDSCVSFRPSTLLSSTGPKDVTVARTGTPVPSPASARNSQGKPFAAQVVPVSAARAVMRSLTAPGAAIPETSPLMSARKTGTPASLSCSAISCSVLVLPVPVAPAIRPCRLSIASGMRTGASGCAAPPTTSAPSSRAGPVHAYAVRMLSSVSAMGGPYRRPLRSGSWLSVPTGSYGSTAR